MPHDTALNVPTHRESVATAPPPAPPPRPVQVVPPSQRPIKPVGVVTWIVWIIVLAGVGVGGYFLYRHVKANLAAAAAGKDRRGGGSGVPVQVARARVGNMDIYLTGLGSVQALNTVTLRTRIDGQVDSVFFIEGQTVYTGEPLFQIDPRPYQVQLTQAEVQLAKDRSILENAQNDLNRNLQAGEAVPAITIDQQKSLVAQAQAAEKIDQGQIAAAKLNVAYTHITAPLTGRIGLRVVDVGNMVHANDSAGLAVITQIQPIAVVFNLPEDNLPQVREHMAARPWASIANFLPPFIRRILQVPTLRVEAYDRDLKKKIATGRLLAVDSQIDATTGTVRLKAVFLNQDESLFPNQFVNARLLVDTLRNVVIIPTAAVQQSPKGPFVYVVKPDKTVEMRQVTVGTSEGDETVVLSGVSGPKNRAVRIAETMLAAYQSGKIQSAADVPNLQDIQASDAETVVVDGVDKLQEGTKVTPRRVGEPATQSSRGPGAGGDASKHGQGNGRPEGGRPQDGSAPGAPGPTGHGGVGPGGAGAGATGPSGASHDANSPRAPRGDRSGGAAPQGAQ